MTINIDNIPVLRAFNQQITETRFSTGKELAAWMGALQAQDYNMSKWALGIRLQGYTEEKINEEINTGRLIRTHLLRPTWHIVSSDDIYWIQELTAPHIRSSVKFRDRQLGLSDSIFRKCNRIFERSLRDNNHKTREELIQELINAKIGVDNNRASHIFLRAEIDGVLCSGKQKGGKPSYAILSEWVPVRKKTYRDENLKELANRYFTSHGPASIHDFSWWSGLSLSNSRLAVELNKSSLNSETIENKTYWFVDSVIKPKPVNKGIFLLPAFDEFLISYKDRTASFLLVDEKKTISNNGIFYPAILMGGQITGTWKRILKNKRIIVTLNLFNAAKSHLPKDPGKITSTYSKFYNKEIELIINPGDNKI